MSHFYANIQGSRGEATRGGTKQSGIQGHIRGWENGVAVFCVHDNQQDEDTINVYATGGSNTNNQDLIFTLKGNKVIFANPDIQILNELSEKRKVDKNE